MADATLQRRHFEFLADVLGKSRTQVATTTEQQETVDGFIDAVIERLHETNSNFNEGRFEQAVIDSM